MTINPLEHIKLVHHVAKKYNYRRDHEDLVQEGMVGLVKAAKKFSPATGNKFSSYAVSCIRGEILHYLRDKSNIIRCPRTEMPLKILSLNCVMTDSDAARDFVECIASPEEEHDPVAELVQKFIETLSDRDQLMLKMRIEGVTRKAVAKKLGVGAMTVSRQMEKLKDVAKERALKTQ
jgi:RNA polymerase sigma factor (sigma-70 family)